MVTKYDNTILICYYPGNYHPYRATITSTNNIPDSLNESEILYSNYRLDISTNKLVSRVMEKLSHCSKDIDKEKVKKYLKRELTLNYLTN